MFGSAPCAPFKEYLETFKQVATDGWAKEKLIELYSDVCFVIKILLSYIYTHNTSKFLLSIKVFCSCRRRYEG
jgi:hypothetical protein